MAYPSTRTTSRCTKPTPRTTSRCTKPTLMKTTKIFIVLIPTCKTNFLIYNLYTFNKTIDRSIHTTNI